MYILLINKKEYKMKNIIIIVMLLCLIFVSCSQEDSVVSNTNSDNKTPNLFKIMNLSLDLDSTLSSIVIESFGTTNETTRSTSAHAAFFSNSDRSLKVNANNLYIDNHLLQADNNNDYYLSDNFSSSYGTTANVGIEGSSYIDSIGFNMYVPEILNVITQDTDTLDKNYDYTLNWNSDNNNTNGVFIHVEYNGSMNTNLIDSSLPDTTIIWNNHVSDTGTYVIDSDVFSGMPVNGIVSIYLARGNASIHGTNQKHLFVAGSLVGEMVKVK